MNAARPSPESTPVQPGRSPRDRRPHLFAGALMLLALIVATFSTPAWAEGRPDRERNDGRKFCKTGWSGVGEWARSDANIDLYNGLLFFAGSTIVTEFGQATRQWSAVNSLDDESRSFFRLAASSARRRTDTVSDALLATSFTILPLSSMAAQQYRTGDCVETWDMMTDFVESFGLVLLATESLKVASGRSRPFVRDCGPTAAGDARCEGDDRFSSFVSGHASLAATGAGLTCAYSIDRQAWGSSLSARAVPCGLGIATALATGALRLTSDRHWLTDVLVGMAIGGTIGFFDLPGPFDLLRYEKRDADGRIERLGLLMPARFESGIGARFTLVY